MVVVYSQGGVPIRLTEERWTHIVTNHPEMDSLREQVLETVAEPDRIQAGDFSEHLAIRRYEHTPLDAKHLIVAYREVDDEGGFIITAYLTRRPSIERTVLWKR